MSGGGDEEERAASSYSAQIPFVEHLASDRSTFVFWYSGIAGRTSLGVISQSLLLSFANTFSELFQKVFDFVQLSKSKARTLLFIHTIETNDLCQNVDIHILT